MLQNFFTDIDQEESYVGQEPVSLSEAKAHCYISHTEDDDYLTGILIPGARQSVENYCHISLVEKTITATLKIENNIRLSDPSGYLDIRDNDNVFELPYGPVKSLLSATLKSSNGELIAMAENEDYLIEGNLYKSMTINSTGTILLVYTSGYKNAIPYDLKLAILNEIAFRYELRGDKTNRYAQQNVGMCESATYLAEKYRRLAWL
jgi:uncharacterized phiE125 gp8 family phage protein